MLPFAMAIVLEVCTIPYTLVIYWPKPDVCGKWSCTIAVLVQWMPLKPDVCGKWSCTIAVLVQWMPLKLGIERILYL